MSASSFALDAVDQVDAMDSADASVVANFAWQHLKAATTFRDQVKVLERLHCGQSLGDFFEDIRSYSSATIMSATAALEALINEHFIATNYHLRPMLTNFEADFWGRNGIERTPILQKYKLALEMLKAQPLDENSATYMNADALIGLRNTLVHYKPNWDPDRQSKIKLVRCLAGQYSLSPFVNANADFVTMQSMSGDCAVWAVDSVLIFLRQIDLHAKLDPHKMEAFWKLES